MKNSVRDAAMEAFKYNYLNEEANRRLAIAVHNGFANKTLIENNNSAFQVNDAIKRCSKNNVGIEDYYGHYR